MHKNLEQKLAEFHEREDCILYASCFDANAGLFEVSHALQTSARLVQEQRGSCPPVMISNSPHCLCTRFCWAQTTRCCPTSWTMHPSSTASACVEPRGCATNTWTSVIWRPGSKRLRCVWTSSWAVDGQKERLLYGNNPYYCVFPVHAADTLPFNIWQVSHILYPVHRDNCIFIFYSTHF